MTSRLTTFRAELKRRKVARVAVTYVVVGLGVLGAAEVILDPLGLAAARPLLVILVLLGFPLALVLAWAYEVRPEEPGPDRARPIDRPEQEALPSASMSTADSHYAEQRKSIVVLPFDNLSPDPGDAYFSDGLTEEITSHLSCCGMMRVISRNSARVLKDTHKDTMTIGAELNVQCVLEGSVRRAGDDLRITAQLIDAGTDTHIWTETYEGTLQDVFDIQERVARSIVEALQLKLGPEEERRLSDRPIDNIHAYECYLRARQDTWIFTEEALDRAVRSLRRGLEIVGDNALLYAGLGYVYSQYVNIGAKHEEYIREAKEYALKALALDPESSEAHLVLGFVDMSFLGRVEEGMGHLKRALAVNPNDAHALAWIVVGSTMVGKIGDAYGLAERVQQVDPLTPMSKWLPTLVKLMDGRFDLPVEELTAWHRLEPENPAALFFCALFLAYAGLRDEARALVEENANPEWTDAFAKLGLLVKLAMEEEHERMTELLTDGFVKTTRRDPQSSYFVGALFAVAGMHEKALDWIENAVRRGFINYPFMALHDPLVKELRDTPQFQKLLARVKTEWESFERHTA